MVTDYEKRIEEDINQIKRQFEGGVSGTKRFQIDVSGTIGRVLYSFVSYWKNPKKEDKGKLIPVEFHNVIRGLEAYLLQKIREVATLENTFKSGGEICRIITEGDKRKIAKLEQYLLEMTVKKPEEGIIELSLNAPQKENI
ncbi:MAG: hypothetical protein Q7S06_01980 [Nanoarchaeota archaeon]|nr:hypothetical protein [Nanoarchaeota archaeon]